MRNAPWRETDGAVQLDGKRVDHPRVTIIVVPRERFGVAKLSLDSIYAGADLPFELVYVDARSPRSVSDWLRTESRARGFRVLHLDHFVTPNEARNLAAAKCKTEYLLFIDNDMACAKNFLGPLVRAADETGAEVVSPLICEGHPFHTRVHQATGSFSTNKEAFFASPYGRREVVDTQRHLGRPLTEVRDQLARTETDVCEFHCLLVRRAFLDRMGGFDEDMYATREHIEFCMSVLKNGGRILFEPASTVTYVHPSSAYPLARADRDFFLLRWSLRWQKHSLDHFQRKWGLCDAGMLAEFREPSNLHWRYHEGFVKPLIRKIPVVRSSWRLSHAAAALLNRYFDRCAERLAADYEKQRAARRRASEWRVLRS